MKKIHVAKTPVFKNLIKILCVLGLFFITCLASAENDLQPELFDKPLEKKVFDLGPSPYSPSQNKKLTCSIYPKFAIQELDEGEMGAKISIHYGSSKNLCQQDEKGKKLPSQGYVRGVVGKYIFVNYNDAFGDLADLTIFNAMTGTKVFVTSYNINQPFEIKKNTNKVSLIYYQPIKATCVPSSTNPSCWQQILKKNNVDPKVKIAAPNCQEAIDRDPDIFKDPEHSIQITVKVLVQDLAKPKLTYLNGNATCHPTP